MSVDRVVVLNFLYFIESQFVLVESNGGVVECNDVQINRCKLVVTSDEVLFDLSYELCGQSQVSILFDRPKCHDVKQFGVLMGKCRNEQSSTFGIEFVSTENASHQAGNDAFVGSTFISATFIFLLLLWCW